MYLTQDNILKSLSKEFNKDVRCVKNVAYYPIKFAKHIIEDPFNDTPIRIKYFGAFTQRYIKDRDLLFKIRTRHLLANIDDVAVMMATTLDFIIPKISSAKKIIDDIIEQKDYEKLDMIWEGWRFFGK